MFKKSITMDVMLKRKMVSILIAKYFLMIKLMLGREKLSVLAVTPIT